MAKKNKYYVVWEGHKPGIYSSWAACQKQVSGYAAAKFRGFVTRAEAEKAFKDPGSVRSNKKSKKKTMYYVVWQGNIPGIYTDWNDAKKQIEGAHRPRYKAFGSKQLAEQAYKDGPEKYEGKDFKKTRDISPKELEKYGTPDPMTISVDAACNNKGDMEYRGVITDSGTEIFRVGPYKNGSNNVGEFLALIHGLAYLKKNKSDIPIYSDSKIAMNWVKYKKAKSKAVTSKELLDLCARGEAWLHNNTYKNPILKWQTKFWGEIPADFGRK